MSKIILARSLPPNAQLTAQRMALTGFPERTWSYDINTPRADPTKVMQVRDIKSTTKRSRVSDYAIAMKPFVSDRSGLTFPPVIFSADGWLIDGNHRSDAAEQLGWLTFPAFTVNFRYENQAEAILKQFLELATLCNVSHGDNLDRENLARIIERLATDDSSASDLGKRLGVQRSTVQSILWARTARLRAVRLGVPYESEHISRTHLADLGRQDTAFNDDVFAALLDLTLKGKLKSGEQKAVIRQILQVKNDPGKLSLIRTELTGRDGIVRNRATRPSPAAQLRQALGKVNAPDPGEMIEPVQGNWKAHKTAARTAIGQLEKMLVRQAVLEEELLRNQG